MLAQDMISYLVGDGLDAVFYDSFLPLARERRILVVTPYGGQEPLLVQESADKRVDVPRFQVLACDRNPAVAEELAVDATNRLARISNREIAGTWYLSVRPLAPPFFLRRDPETERVEYAANFEAKKAIEEVAAGS